MKFNLNGTMKNLSQSLFYWIIYSYIRKDIYGIADNISLNPYFIGLSTLISVSLCPPILPLSSQSLFYWIIYSYYTSPIS